MNDNEAQSAIFIDDVQVMHNKPVRIAFTNASSVIAQESILIEGVISIDSETDTYQTLSLTLKDNAGNEIDKIEESGLNLKKGDTYKFAFTKALPLVKGIVNDFTITLFCNDNRYEIAGKVSNLAFEPVKHIVIEEYSGRMCSNCPLGIVGIERLEELYGELIIPICLRTYGDDPLGTGMQDYSAFLGFTGAPSGVINRLGVSYPAVSSAANTTSLTQHFPKVKIVCGPTSLPMNWKFLPKPTSTSINSQSTKAPTSLSSPALFAMLWMHKTSTSTSL